MKRADLMNMIGSLVKVVFKDGKEATGTLGYTDKFCEEQGYRKPNYFTVGDWSFKASHVKKCTRIFLAKTKGVSK